MMLMTLQATRLRRRASSLVEVLVVISLTGLMFGVVVTTLASLLRHQQATRTRVAERSEIIRLTDALRSDLRRGAQLSQPNPMTLEVVPTTGFKVRYEISGDKCLRQVVPDWWGRPRHEGFTIGPVSGIRLVEEQEGDMTSRTLWIDRAADDVTGVGQPPIRIVAALVIE